MIDTLTKSLEFCFDVECVLSVCGIQRTVSLLSTFFRVLFANPKINKIMEYKSLCEVDQKLVYIGNRIWLSIDRIKTHLYCAYAIGSMTIQELY